MQPNETKQPDEKPAEVVVKSVEKKIPRQRHFLAVFFLSFMWGMFGVDRFYLGKIGTGILKLVTFGGYGFWVVIDIALIMTGAMRDKQGREMLQVNEYKKFAGKTVLIFALVLGAVVLLTGLSLIYAISQLITMLMSGDLLQMIPGLDGLNGTNPFAPSIPEELQQDLNNL